MLNEGLHLKSAIEMARFAIRDWIGQGFMDAVGSYIRNNGLECDVLGILSDKGVRTYFGKMYDAGVAERLIIAFIWEGGNVLGDHSSDSDGTEIVRLYMDNILAGMPVPCESKDTVSYIGTLIKWLLDGKGLLMDTLVHEIQHAYDSTASKGRLAKDREWNRYGRKYGDTIENTWKWGIKGHRAGIPKPMHQGGKRLAFCCWGERADEVLASLGLASGIKGIGLRMAKAGDASLESIMGELRGNTYGRLIFADAIGEYMANGRSLRDLARDIKAAIDRKAGN